MLTKKQSELLRFIHERLKETGVPPSFDEMKDALNLPLEVGHSPADHRARGARLYPPPAKPRPRARGFAAAGIPRRPPKAAGASDLRRASSRATLAGFAPLRKALPMKSRIAQ